MNTNQLLYKIVYIICYADKVKYTCHELRENQCSSNLFRVYAIINNYIYVACIKCGKISIRAKEHVLEADTFPTDIVYITL